MKLNKIIITGAAGRLGELLLSQLKDLNNYSVLGLDVRNEKKIDRIHECDLSQYAPSWTEHFHDCDTIIHLAGSSSPDSNWSSVTGNNIEATFNVFHAAVEHGVNRVIIASSSWVMDGYKDTDIKISHSLPPGPTNAYGASKLMAEQIGKYFSSHYDLSVICFRIGWVTFSPAAEAKKNRTTWDNYKYLSDRDFLHGITQSLIIPDIKFEVLNLMSNNLNSKWDISRTIKVLNYCPKDGI